MIRRDNSQDAERPRNYSSFWIEVAQGKEGSSSSGAALSDDILDLDVPVEDTGDDLAALADLTELAAPAAPAKPARSKPVDKKPEAPRSLSSLADLANIDMLMKNSADLGDETDVDLASDEAEDLEVPLTSDYNFEDTDTGEDEEVEAESLEEFDEGDFDDEEEDDDWGGRKTKQSKPQKQRRPERRQY